MKSSFLSMQDICKSFDSQVVLDKVSMDIERGEFITILGSSGCGKTTILRIIAGLETPDSGKVFCDGVDITSLAPEKRNLNMVFQNYALFEHMTVEENIGYSLKLMGIKKEERASRVSKMLSDMSLEGMGKRLPEQMSGGQRQRVAIARAIINQPKVLLLDEPLGALDRNLRKRMQVELKELQKKIGITFIYITHDQEEAIYLSDRIAVLNKGHFVQFDTTEKILNSQVPFVRQFLSCKEEQK